jgi:hypothetical protein
MKRKPEPTTKNDVAKRNMPLIESPAMESFLRARAGCARRSVCEAESVEELLIEESRLSLNASGRWVRFVGSPLDVQFYCSTYGPRRRTPVR